MSDVRDSDDDGMENGISGDGKTGLVGGNCVGVCGNDGGGCSGGDRSACNDGGDCARDCVKSGGCVDVETCGGKNWVGGDQTGSVSVEAGFNSGADCCSTKLKKKLGFNFKKIA